VTDIRERNRRNRRKGAEWEIALTEGLRAAGEDIERLRTKGRRDESDHLIREPGGYYLLVESKNAARFEPGAFIAELDNEIANFITNRGVPPERVNGIVIVKRRGRNWHDAYVLTTVARYFDLDNGA
jgi:hypothetical protein